MQSWLVIHAAEGRQPARGFDSSKSTRHDSANISEVRLIVWKCDSEGICNRTEQPRFNRQVLKVIDLEREPELCLRT